MKTGIRCTFGILTLLLSFSPLQAATSSAPSTAQQDAVKQKLSAMQIPFIENKGQVDKSVAFYAPTFAGTVFVTKKGELVYALPAKQSDDDNESRATQVLTERLVAGKAVPAPLTAAATKVSYFLGNDRSKWQSGVATHSAVSLGEVWKGIDVELHAYGRNVEKFFTVRPGASVESIQVQLDGAESLALSTDGALNVATDSGVVRFTPPVAWQEKEGKKLPVKVAYVVKDDAYGFSLGEHDASLAVIIDPLLQSTYLGGDGDDTTSDYYKVYTSIAIHPVTGDVYVAGSTNSTNFPGAVGGAQTAVGGYNDAFVARLNSSLTVLLLSTYLGGSYDDYATTLAIHPISGEVYVGGYAASGDFPGTAGGAQSATGFGDAFVARLNSDLSVLLQSTYLGGSSYMDYVTSLAIHPMSGEVYATGYTASTDFPGIAGGAQSAYGGGYHDSFVTRLSSSLSTLLQSTYLGGSHPDTARALAIHPISGEVYVAGYDNAAFSTSQDFPGIAGGAQETYGGGDGDGFVARLSSNLSTLLQSTYLGGLGWDEVKSLAIHPVSGEVYVAGGTTSFYFPGTAGGAQPGPGGGLGEGFIARLNSNLTTLLQSTYLAGSDWDDVKSLAIHPISGDVFVTGTPSMYGFPGTNGGAQSVFRGLTDGYVTRLNSNLTTLTQSTLLGGTGDDYSYSLAIHPTSGEVYVAGVTYSSNFPNTSGGAQPDKSRYGDSFVARLTPSLALNDYTLTTTLSGSGSGMVTSTDNLINCGSDCSETYGNFLAITLNATPESGSIFASWSGACNGIDPTCTVTMNAAKSVTAKFNATSFTLNISRKGRGTVTSTDGLINCSTDCSEIYAARTSVTLTATPASGYVFSGWSGGGCSGTGSCIVSINADKSVKATFNVAAVN